MILGKNVRYHELSAANRSFGCQNSVLRSIPLRESVRALPTIGKK